MLFSGKSAGKIRTAVGNVQEKINTSRDMVQGKVQTVQKHYRRVKPFYRNRKRLGKIIYSVMYLFTYWKR